MTTTKHLMTSHPRVIKASDTLLKAYEIMHELQIRHLPVLDGRNKVVGILSDRDIQRAMSVKKLNAIQKDVMLDEKLLVEDFMSWPVFTVSESTPIKKVAQEMLDQKVSAFLVEDSLENLKGIITTDDLLKYIISEEKIQQHMSSMKISHFFQGPAVL